MSDGDIYDWSEFELSMYYLRPRPEVFRSWATSRGLESFFIARAEHTSAEGDARGRDEIVQAGDEYHWSYVHDFQHAGRYIAVEMDERLTFSFGPMTVDIGFREFESGTEVHLHQTGCAVTDPDRMWHHVNCRSCWIYFMTNLRAVLHSGVDLRDHEHPALNDSVSVGWNRPDRSGEPGISQPEGNQ